MAVRLEKNTEEGIREAQKTAKRRTIIHGKRGGTGGSVSAALMGIGFGSSVGAGGSSLLPMPSPPKQSKARTSNASPATAMRKTVPAPSSLAKLGGGGGSVTTPGMGIGFGSSFRQTAPPAGLSVVAANSTDSAAAATLSRTSVEAKPREGLNRASTSTVTTSSVVSAGKGASRVRPSKTQVEGEKDEPSLAVVPKGPSKPRDTKKENEIAKQELAELDKFEQNELIGKLGSKDQAKKTLRLKEYNKAVGGMR